MKGEDVPKQCLISFRPEVETTNMHANCEQANYPKQVNLPLYNSQFCMFAVSCTKQRFGIFRSEGVLCAMWRQG